MVPCVTAVTTRELLREKLKPKLRMEMTLKTMLVTAVLMTHYTMLIQCAAGAVPQWLSSRLGTSCDAAADDE